MVQRFPGLIDVHVHLRDPGATHKEDLRTGSRAAVAGGFTYILDMPNNPQPTFTIPRLNDKIRRSRNLPCDIGFHYGTKGDNLASFPIAWKNTHVFGLKLYCNHTTGDYLIEDLLLLEGVFAAWKSEKPILVHAEGAHLAATIALAIIYGRRLHVCHISQLAEVELVRKTKQKKHPVTCGVTPHHLFLTNKDKQFMKPPLGTQKDQDALWDGVGDGTIDIVESDHAPHTREEKQKIPVPFGVPGLETTLGLLLKAVHEKKLSLKEIKRLLYDRPKELFAIRDQPQTYIEFDPDKPYMLRPEDLVTKCGWSPFENWQLYGRVEKVVYKGKQVVG